MEENKFKISTITAIINLSTRVNYHNAFYLLPITRINPRPGDIINLKLEKYKRGQAWLEKSRRAKHDKDGFLNSTTISLLTPYKKVSLKLTTNKIHICGVTSDEMALCAGKYIVRILNRLQHDLTKIYNNMDKMLSIIDRLRRGELVLETFYRPWNILVNALSDFEAESYWNWLRSKPILIQEPIKILSLEKSMIKCNYHLGFPIKRRKLYQLMNNRDGFIANYCNTINHSVYLYLKIEEQIKTSKRNKGNHYHSFTIHKTGSVTQSGPSLELIRKAYIRLMKNIAEIREYIERKDDDSDYSL